MKPFIVLGKFATCVLGILGVCLSFPESLAAKVKIVTVSVTTHHSGGIGDISPTEIVCELTCDGYVYITADSNGKTLVYNNDKKFSTDPADLIDLSSDYIKNQNNAEEGKVDPDRFGWGSYKLTVEGASTSLKPIGSVNVKMDGGTIGEIVLGGGGYISAIDFKITGGSINRFICTGTVLSTCNISMSNCTIRGSEGLVYDAKNPLSMSWSDLTLTHGDGITYGNPHEMINSIKFLKDKGATINNSFRPTNNVYEIHDATDFYWFEDYVNTGSSNMNGKLMNDIEIVSNTMIGTNEHPYQYEFDGNGHMISGLNLGSNLSPMAWSTYKNIVYAGLFGYVKGTASKTAKIKNLTVEGRIYCTSLTTTDLFVAGGVVGIAEQYVEISDVVSNVSISNYKNVKAHIGGIAGTTESTDNGPLYIDRCVYKGTIVQDGYNCCGGIVGYIYKGHIHDCLNAGTITNDGNVDGSWVCGILGYVNDWNKSNCFTMKRCLNVGTVSGNNSYAIGFANNCQSSVFESLYYKEGSATSVTNGTAVFGTSLHSVTDEQLKSGEVTYALNGGSTSNPTWRQTIGTDDYPTLDASHKVVYHTYKNCESTVQYSNEDNGRTSEGHNYEDGFCTYCKAVDPDYMTAKNGYYELSKAQQLKWFAAYVNAGVAKTPVNVKLMADLDMRSTGFEAVGTVDHPYSGTFDGREHSVTLSINGDTLKYQGIIGYVSGTTTVKNLTMKGSVSCLQYAGLVGGSSGGSLTISNCANYANVTTTSTGSGNASGIYGVNMKSSTSLKIENCLNAGIITGKEAGAISGYIGNGTVTNCLNYGKVTGTSADAFVRMSNTGTVTNSYCYKPFGSVSELSGATEVSTKDLSSGKITYALNGNSSSNTVWRQTLETDSYPVLDSSHKVVYNYYAKCAETTPSVYNNENTGRTTNDHSWDQGSITTQPNCTEPGVKTFTCKYQCGTPKTEPVAALGHTEEAIPAVEPTCVETGSKDGKKCSVCNVTTVEPTVVAAKGHKEETLAAVAPTCTETGLTEGKKCSVCDLTLLAQTEVAANGHKEEIIPAHEPSCVEMGLTAGKKCSVCKVTLEEQTIIPPTGHTLGSVESDAIDHWFICKTCEAMYGEEDHNHNAEDHSCSVCGVDKAETDEEGYYLVGNSKQLYWLQDYIDSYNRNANVRLIDDIVVNDNLLNSAGELNESDTDLLVWNPISEYQGTFDGQGHSIRGLFCKSPYKINVGFFAQLYSMATIRNLEISDSYFEGITTGAICGVTWYATIENCASHNTIKGQNIGGLVGVGTPQIKNSISTCKLVASSVVEGAETHAGLLVGVIKPEDGMSSSYNSYMDAEIENCFYATSSDLNPFGQSVSYTGDGSVNSVLDTLRAVKKPLSAFKSGEVAYLLNQSYNKETKEWTNNEETPTWRQNLLGRHADAFPVPNPSHKLVVKVAEGKTYSYTVKEGKQFGTFCYDVDVALPESMSAFHTVYVDNNKIYGMIVEDGFVPAGTPVILRKPSTKNSVTISFSGVYANTMLQLDSTCTSGQLVGLLKVEDGQKLPMGDSQNFTYTMQTIDGVQNFYVINSGNFKATQYRCYLDTRVGQNSFQMQAAMNRGECLFDCEETGLQELSSKDQASTPVYNLQGQRVQRMDRGGIYVQNNKRSMIK